MASYQNVQFNNQVKVLEAFFDIYENDDSNDAIIQCLEQSDTNEDIEEQLYYLLPLYTPYVRNISEKMINRSVLRSSFNVSAASNYARAYAVTPNSTDYDVFSSGDCANFASQIMEHGGISQEDDVQWPWVGWWHVREGNSHYCSKSWSVADTFARYMGVMYSSQSHYNFSAHLQAGDFILVDSYNDGSWNHVGYVLQVDDYLTDGYYDYFVAQHSGNYLAWTSTGSNDWELQESEGNSYGIIRK